MREISAYVHITSGPYAGTVLVPGDRPDPEVAKYVTNPACWTDVDPIPEAGDPAPKGDDASVNDPKVPDPDVTPDPKVNAGPSIEELRADAAILGVKVDKRWGADRLLAEIAKAKARGDAS